MTCKHLYMHAACNHPEAVIKLEGKPLYPICDYVDLRECPHYEEKENTNES